MWHITPESHYHSFKQAPFCAADASPSARFAAPRGRVRLRLPPGSAGFAQSARTALRVARHTTRHSDESMTFVGLRPSPPRRPSLPICSRPGRFGAMPPFAQAGADVGRRRSPRLRAPPGAATGPRGSAATVVGLHRPGRRGTTPPNGRMSPILGAYDPIAGQPHGRRGLGKLAASTRHAATSSRQTTQLPPCFRKDFLQYR